MENIFCPNHPLEIMLYEYYVSQDNYKISSEALHKKNQELASECMKHEDYSDASNYIVKALEYNPVDVELYELDIMLKRNEKDWELMKETAFTMFPYCFTRKDLAVFYRTIGLYMLELYRPDEAMVLYSYSNIFYKSKTADSEISYLETAIKKKLPSYSIEELAVLVEKYGIPCQPAKETLALMYHTARQELENNNIDYAKILLLELYRLTGDSEVEEMLKNL